MVSTRCSARQLCGNTCTTRPKTTCSMCLEEYGIETTHKAACIPCGHIFGESCLREWLGRPDGHRCPACGKPATKDRITVLFGDVGDIGSTQFGAGIERAKEILRDATDEVNRICKVCDDDARRLTIPQSVRDYIAGNRDDRIQMFLDLAREISEQDSFLKSFIGAIDSYKAILQRCDDARTAVSISRLTEESPLLNDATLGLMAREVELNKARHRLDSILRSVGGHSTCEASARRRVIDLLKTRAVVFHDFVPLSEMIAGGIGKLSRAQDKLTIARDKLDRLNKI